jgi:glyoxylase-like metal-dependent hydrolase (beta-lactamase superfamily II)
VNRVLRLHLADVVYPAWHPNDGVGPVYAFAVTTSEGTILVDTGIGPANATIDAIYRPTRYNLEGALRLAGIAPASVVAVVNSHLHFDHCGNNAAFPGIPTWVQAVELEAAKAPRYTIPEFFEAPGVRYQPIDGPAEVVPGVRIVATPGHTAGHQSVLVETADGPELIATQAFETLAEFSFARAEGRAARDYPQLAGVLRDLVAVHVSHDHKSWRSGPS